MRTLFTLENDGHNEPSIWATIEYEDSGGKYAVDEPICVLQRCELPFNARPFWPTIVARLVDLEEEAGEARSGTPATTRPGQPPADGMDGRWVSYPPLGS